MLKLRIDLGFEKESKEIYWKGEEIGDFPKVLKYDGKKWEWLMYEMGDYPIDYVLKFKEMPMYDTRYWDQAPNLEEMLGEIDRCECGAKFCSFSWDHLRYCPKWRPW